VAGVIRALGDDANVGAVINPEHVDAVFQAYEDIGIRAYVGVTLFDKPFIRAVPFVEEEVGAGTASSVQCSPYMSSRADMCRKRADDAKNRAAQAKNLSIKSAFEEVAACWRVLAE